MSGGGRSGRTLAEVRRFLAEWASRMKPVYMAVSLPDTFAYPEESPRVRFLRQRVLPLCEERGVPLSLMIGVRYQVNPAAAAGGGRRGQSGSAGTGTPVRRFPRQSFPYQRAEPRKSARTLRLCAQIRNLMPFGCWWFLNNPSVVEEMTRERLEMLGASFIPQHSDARVLEQVIYKWRNTRRTLTPILANSYQLMSEDGRPVTREDIRRDITRMFRGKLRNLYTPFTPMIINTPANNPAAKERLSIFGTKLRWSICGLLFFATTVNYVDRQVLGILKPVLEGTRLEGHRLRRCGVGLSVRLRPDDAVRRPGDGLAGHAAGLRAGGGDLEPGVHEPFAGQYAVSVRGGAVCAGDRGIVEFSGGTRDRSRLVPAGRARFRHRHLQQRVERRRDGGSADGPDCGGALRMALVVSVHRRAGCDLAGAVAELLPPAPAAQAPDYRRAFADQGGPRGRPAIRLKYSQLLTKRAAWAFLFGKFMTDPVWWFYLFWVPGFLHDKYGLDLTHLGLPLFTIYVVADLGSVGGGWLSKGMVARGMQPGLGEEAGDAALRDRGDAGFTDHVHGRQSVADSGADRVWRRRRIRAGPRTCSPFRRTRSRGRQWDRW